MSLRAALAFIALVALFGCVEAPAPSPVVAPTPAPTIPDERPEVPSSAPYTPPVPELIALPPFLEGRLIERTALDLVSLRVVIPHGSAEDPSGREGLAALTAEMMEQGAGDLDGFALSLAAERIGADIRLEAYRDYSIASVDVVASRLLPALALTAELVLRPRLEAAEWARTKALRLEDLEGRAFESRRVAAVVSDAVLYGAGHPYGHPVEGLLAGVRAMSVDDVRDFHQRAWRVDRATVVAVGKVDGASLRAAVAEAFKSMPQVDGAPVHQAAPTAPTQAWPRFVIVHRADAPQTVLRLSWPGPAANADGRQTRELVDFVLGGSFTSRLNSNLREDKGYTYGARSRLPMNRGAGAFAAGAAVQAEVTGKALKELLAELEGIAGAGPTGDEVGKARASLRNDDVQAYEEVAGAADRLAILAGLGLAARYDVNAAAARLRPSHQDIKDSARFFFPDRALLTAVGDRAAIEAQLAEEGIDLGPPEIRDAEGRRVP